MAHLLADEDGLFGEELVRAMQDYNHYAAIGVLGEILPDARNCVTIHPTEKDQFGIPVPYVHFSLFENDRRMMRGRHRPRQGGADGGRRDETHAVDRYAHLVGTCRMGFTPTRLGGGSLVPQLGRAQPARLRRQRPADPGLGQSGADDLGAGGAHGGLAAPGNPTRRPRVPLRCREVDGMNVRHIPSSSPTETMVDQYEAIYRRLRGWTKRVPMAMRDGLNGQPTVRISSEAAS